jgi:hypothetical protein
MMDIFDGLYYCSLLGQHVIAGDQKLTYNYFSDDCNIALSFAMDSFAPFKRWNHTMWILLIFNYNLPSDQHFQKDNILCARIIPSPNKPWDADSFIYPLMKELLKLAIGVSAYDALSKCLFALHAYVIAGFSDISTVSMLMYIKGHNGLCLCQMCKIQGICISDLQNNMLYVPLPHLNHPAPTSIIKYDLENLPLHLHNHIMAQANSVESMPIKVWQEELVKAYGIKGVPILSALGSLRFP